MLSCTPSRQSGQQPSFHLDHIIILKQTSTDTMGVLSPPETHSSIAFYAIIGLVGTVVYFLSLALYRLYFSPLAKFPGPKLAALTQWYETYYELFSGDGGQFIWHYAKLHEEYGKWALTQLLTHPRSHRVAKWFTKALLFESTHGSYTSKTLASTMCFIRLLGTPAS